MMSKPSLVCLTPVRNEAWVLERFLAAAATWADAIVVADQGSDDGSREIASSHAKVILVDNPSEGYDEGARQRLLLETARRHVPGRRVLLALDADEALTADATSTVEWRTLMTARPGTSLRFRWANLMPRGEGAWVPPDPIAFGFADDGAEHQGQRIHSTRVPAPPEGPVLTFEDILVLHLQYVDWERTKSKQRWYQCWERLENPHKRPIQIYRQYHQMDAVDPKLMRPVPHAWLEGYERAGIDLREVSPEPAYPWDGDVLRWISEDPRRMARVDVWDVDWPARARTIGVPEPPVDPRTASERRVLRWLARTQPRAQRSSIRWVQRALRPLGW